MIQSLLSFSTGGLTGKGLGNGIQKLGYLPEDTTDFIFAVICEELGLFGALLTVGAVSGHPLRRVADDEDRNAMSFARMLAFGIGSMVGLQATINIAVATVSVPTKAFRCRWSARAEADWLSPVRRWDCSTASRRIRERMRAMQADDAVRSDRSTEHRMQRSDRVG